MADTDDLGDAAGRGCLEKDCIDERTQLARAGRRAAWWTAYTGVVFAVELVASSIWWGVETAVRRRRDGAR